MLFSAIGLYSDSNGAGVPLDGGWVMARIRTLVVALLALVPLAFATSPAHAEKRIALVIGNASYQAGALETPANDAGLIAQTLQAAGFDVVGARDLDQDSLRRAFRDFLEKATSSGPDTVAFVYLSGHGLQLEGQNYFVPIDARIARDMDVAAEALRISDYTRPLAALRLKASIVVLDAARANQFATGGPPLAGGLALVDPEPGVLIAFNAAPGTVAQEGQGPYGPYAQALAEMLREGGLPLAGVFDRTRLRVNDMTKGALVPWHASKVQTALMFFERAPDAPPPAVSPEQTAAIRARPMRELGAQDAYALALERDSVQGYQDFIAAYPDDPMSKRVRAIVAARREAITWRRTCAIDTPPAYWSYLRRYPDGPHATDAHRRLAYLSAALEPPPAFAAVDYELPPPPPEEVVYVRRPVLVFDDPIYAFAPPPPAPVFFLAPPPPEFVFLAPPPPPVAVFVLPIPVYRPVPVWVRPPVYVARAAAQQRDLQQHPQHGRHQQCDEQRHGDESERPDQDRCPPPAPGGCAAARRGAGRAHAGARCRGRAGAAAVGRAEGGQPPEPARAGTRTSARGARSGGDATAGSTGTAFAGNERAAIAADAVGCDDTGDAAGAWRWRKARSAAAANACCEIAAAVDTVRSGDSGDTTAGARRWCKARNAAVASARREAGNATNAAVNRDYTGSAITAAGRECKAGNSAVINAGSQADVATTATTTIRTAPRHGKASGAATTAGIGQYQARHAAAVRASARHGEAHATATARCKVGATTPATALSKREAAGDLCAGIDPQTRSGAATAAAGRYTEDGGTAAGRRTANGAAAASRRAADGTATADGRTEAGSTSTGAEGMPAREDHGRRRVQIARIVSSRDTGDRGPVARLDRGPHLVAACGDHGRAADQHRLHRGSSHRENPGIEPRVAVPRREVRMILVEQHDVRACS